MNPHKISAHSDNKQKSYGMLLIELVTWGVTNRDVLLLATIRYLENKVSYDKQARQEMLLKKTSLSKSRCYFSVMKLYDGYSGPKNRGNSG